MSYQVLARKWRPQTFGDVVGQEAVTQTLSNAIRHGRVAHAFLFAGLRGVGKTSTARILAMALNCQKGISDSPCGKCDACREIGTSSSVDVLEIDAASNTGIDNIREIRESARYQTARDRFKIFIIDEVHMLSKGAFNALLKTLEEPPSHVKFILATTEFHKIPETIASRCQHFEFKRIPLATIADRLGEICRQEGTQISAYALQAIAANAQGSMRDALSALDRVLAFAGGEVKDEDVTRLLGLLDHQVVIDLVDPLIRRDRDALLARVARVAASGVEAQSVVHRLIEHVRNLSVCKIAGWDERLLQLPDAFRDSLTRQADQLSHLELVRFYDLLVRVEEEMRLHHNPHLHLEMALLQLIELAGLSDLETTLSNLPPVPLAKTPAGDETVAGPLPRSAAPPPEEPVTSPTREPKAVKTESLAENRLVRALLLRLQDENLPLHASLCHASEMTHGQGTLRIVFERNAAFHYRVLEPAMKESLSVLCGELAGEETRVSIELQENTKSADGPAPLDEPAVQQFLKAFPGKYSVEAEKTK